MDTTEIARKERWTVVEAEVELLRRLRAHDPENPEEAPKIATTLSHLAYIYQDIGRLEEAERNYKKALSLYRTAMGAKCENVAITLNNLGTLYREMGQFRVAAKSHLCALEIERTLFGETHVTTAATFNNLGAVYESLEFRKRAEVLYRQSYVIYRNLLGPMSTEARVARVNLRRTSRQTGSWLKPFVTVFRRMRIKLPTQRL